MIERERLIELINDVKDIYPTIPIINGMKQDSSEVIADHLLSNGVIVPPCKVGDKVYLIYRGEVTQGVVRLIRPFISQESTIFKGNVICEVDNPFLDDGSKEEVELYVVFEKSYGIERIAYLTKEEAEKALKERSEGE